MANIARIRLPGFWVLGSVVYPGEFEAFDAARPKQINAEDGSAHAPTEPVILGGTGGLTVTGPLTATDARDIQVQSGSSITINSGAKIVLAPWTGVFPATGYLQCDGFIEVRDGALLQIDDGGVLGFLNGAVASFLAGSSMSFASGASLTIASGATLAVDGQLNVNGFCTITPTGELVANSGSIVTLGGTVVRTGPLTISGDVATTSVRKGFLTDADQTYGPTKDIWYMPATRAANRIHYLEQTPPPPDGTTMLLTIDVGPVSAFTIEVYSETAGNLVGRFPASDVGWMKVVYDATNSKWRRAEWAGGSIETTP